MRKPAEHGPTGREKICSYDYSKSTQENHASKLDQCGIFHGKFASIREKIDPRWHGCYSAERQLTQDEIISNILRLNTNVPPCDGMQTHPWIIFTGGAMGSGKGYCMNWLIKKGVIPLRGLRHVDPDVFKRSLPEWKGYVKLNPETAGSMTHLESSMMVEIAQELALQRNMNVWIDGSLSNSEWTYSQLGKIRDGYPMYRIALFHVSASEKKILERCEKRARATGRIVPIDKTKQSIPASLSTVQNLPANLVDLVAFIENNVDVPSLRYVNGNPVHPHDWSIVRNFFHQSGA
jgi:hypothetical protein